MRRYTLTVNETTRVIDVEAVGANLFRVQLDGRLIDVTLDDHRDLAHSAVTPAITPRAVPSRVGTESEVPSGSQGGEVAAVAASVPAGRVPVRAASAGAGGGLDKVTAPMPGVIISVECAVGDMVKRGDTLLVLEAMKMKNELKAVRDGQVAEIYVATGAQVKYGETLVRLEGN